MNECDWKKSGKLQAMIATQAVWNSITMNPLRMTHTLTLNAISKTEMQWCLRAAWSINISYRSMYTYHSFLFFYFLFFSTKIQWIHVGRLSLLHTIRIYYVAAVTYLHTHTHRKLVFPVCGIVLTLIYAKYPINRSLAT